MPKTKTIITTNKKELEEDIRRTYKELSRLSDEFVFYTDFSKLSSGDEIAKRKEELIKLRDKIRMIIQQRKSMSTSVTVVPPSAAMETLTEATVNEMSPEKVLYMNKGLIHLLYIIDKAPGGQISTVKLLDTIKSYDLHRLIKKGEELGFIKREKVPKPKGQKGNNMTVNSLSKEGRMLLEAADKIKVDSPYTP